MIKHESHVPFYRSRIAFGIAWGVILIAGVILAIILGWLVWPAQLVTTDPDTTTDKNKYKPGDTVLLNNPRFCNYGVDVSVKRRVQTIDEKTGAGGSLLLPPIEFYENQTGKEFVVNGEPSDCMESTTRLELPEELFPGRWRIINETTFKANPVRTVTIKTTSNWFIVE